MQIYTIPGLGFDSRIFQNIIIKNTPITHLEWKEPQSDQPLSDYAKMYLEEIKGENIILIGHSFGGVLSLEISKLIPVQKVFLISSIRNENEMPVTFKAISNLKLYNLVTPNQLAQSIPFWGKFYDYANGNEIKLVMDMIRKNSKNYLQWAVKTITHWKFKGDLGKTQVYQIHGTHDKTFPISKIKQVDLSVQKGGHFMVYKHGAIISDYITDVLEIH